MNSSRRTSDEKHAFIARVFGKRLERNGIEYQLNGVSYHDTQNWSHRLINAYRRYLEIYNALRPGDPSTTANNAWVYKVGRAQRQSMPHDIQRFLEKGKPFYPLPKYRDVKERALIRANVFYNCTVDATENFYPLRLGTSGCGINFGLSKQSRQCYARIPALWYPPGWWPEFDLAAVRQIVEVREVRFNELLLGLEKKLYPSSFHDHGAGGCIVS